MTNYKRTLPRTRNEREVEGWRRSQDDDNNTKANKVVGGIPGNLVILKADGDIDDSLDTITAIETRSSRRSYFYGRAY